MNKYLTKLEDFLDLYFVKKVPVLPEKVKETIAESFKFSIVMSIIFSVLYLIACFFFPSFLKSYIFLSSKDTVTFNIYAFIVFSQLVLSIIVVSGIFKRTMFSWRIMYYIFMPYLIFESFIVEGGGGSDIISVLILYILCLYVLFQVKPLYKN